MYYAHSTNGRECNPLRKHLADVGERARKFAEAFGCGEDARLAGLLHDLGKYGDLFQARLRGEESGLDHWSAGASVCLERFQHPHAALAVQGHHIGLQSWDVAEFRKLQSGRLESNPPGGRRLTAPTIAELIARLTADGLALPPAPMRPAIEMSNTATMLDVRMLLSALADADYLETERHFDEAAALARDGAVTLEPQAASETLDSFIEEVKRTAPCSAAVSGLRHDLLTACRDAAAFERGLFTLTAPTGAGKTLSTLSFALRHARLRGLRRIVIVLPYLSIIEQTAAVYRKALGNPSDSYLLEHHSLAIESGALTDQGGRLRALLVQNWDAPVIVTTSVQFLESLFSNSPAACRKLHRLAESIVVFDEVQTLPLKLVLPTLATLSHLSRRYAATVVFSTATQPAFPHLDARVRAHYPEGWRTREIVPRELELFRRASRVKVNWPGDGERRTWEEISVGLAGKKQALCIVNLKRHACDVFKRVRERRGEECLHLSTAMCPRHRQAVLAEVRRRLGEGVGCVLISTQCVEAGVDVDFPVVYRAMGPLDAIAQAAGRCNRNGRSSRGEVRVFVPTDDGDPYPNQVYAQAADATAALLQADSELSIDDPAAFEKYYGFLYSVAKLEERHMREALVARNFVEVRKHYRLIEQDAVNVLVKYDDAAWDELAREARNRQFSRDWVRRARPFAVNWRRAAAFGLEPVPLKSGQPVEDWFLDLEPGHYDPFTGFQGFNGVDLLEV